MSLASLKACGIDELLAGGTPTLPVFYQKNGSPSEIVDLVALSNKRFGTDMETLVCGLTGCKKVPDTVGETGWDCEHEETNNFPEIKSSRYWQAVKDWRWQHILADHEWSHVILAAVDFQEIKLFLLTKDTFMVLIEKGIVTQQGGAGGQGCWMQYRKAAQFLHPITGELDELHKNTTNLFNEYPSSREAKTKEEIDEALQKGRLVIEAGKKIKAEERAVKKAGKEAEKQRKAEERRAKKAGKEAEKQRKAEERRAKKAGKEAEKKIKAEERAVKKAGKEAEKSASTTERRFM